MLAEHSSDVKFEIGHVLFIDIVGYSKLLINEQSEQIQKLKESCAGQSSSVSPKRKVNCCVCRPAMAARWFFGPVRKRRFSARWKSAKHSRVIPNFKYAWGSIAAR